MKESIKELKEKWIQEGYNKGYQKGYKEGYQDGIVKADTIISKVIK